MNDTIADEIDKLVAASDVLAADAAVSESNLGHDRVRELRSICARAGNIISQLYGRESHYYESFSTILGNKFFTTMHSNYCDHVAEIAGVLHAIQTDLKAGLLSNIKSLAQAEIFADFLEMSEHLLRAGYKDPAAVLLGAVLENSLRKIAESSGISVIGESGKALTIDPLNSLLKKEGLYGALIQKQITSWANLRNDAAHGRFNEYDSDQVRQMQVFVEKFCADYLGK